MNIYIYILTRVLFKPDCLWPLLICTYVFLCACIPPSLPKCKFQRTCDQILCAKRSFQHSHREGRKKRWAVSGERPDGAMWHILERSPLSPCAPIDAIRFLCQGFGPRSTVDFWEGFGKLPQDPQKISKKSEERGSNRTLMNLPGSERSKIQLFQMLFQQHNWPYILSGAGRKSDPLENQLYKVRSMTSYYIDEGHNPGNQFES